MTPDEIRAARVDLDVTQQQLAAMMGVKVLAVSRWERGVQKLPETPRLLLRAFLDGWRPK